MPKKQWSDEERKAFGAKMKAKREEKLKSDEPKETPPTPPPAVEPPEVPTEHPQEDVVGEQDVDQLRRQVEEMKQNMDLMTKLLLNQNNQGNQGSGVQMNRGGELIGEFEKYLVDPANYPDPTPRLAKEARLAPLAFEHNYELTYEVGVSSYETKTGKNIKEPKFLVTLYRVVLDDQGNRVQVTDQKTGKTQDKFYVARKMVFHEDPQAAMVIAREQGLEVNHNDEKLFLNEMRYYRVRDWLFDIFWPSRVQDESRMQEEVIGGQIVQVYTRNSEESGSIPFDQMTTKLRT